MSWDIGREEFDELIKEQNWDAIWELMEWLRDYAVEGRCVRCGYCTKDLDENQTPRKK
jgi:hypothetical protein